MKSKQLTRLGLLALLIVGAALPVRGALRFDGTNDLVTFGVAPGLGVTNFTLECWFKPVAGGKRGNTGTGGYYAYPLVTKGVAENEVGNTNMNFFLGVSTNNAGQAVLFADFEDMNTGLNHPVRGVGTVANGVWQHAAVTYNVASSNWVLYLNGVPDFSTNILGLNGGIITNILQVLPRFDSIQHGSLGSCLKAGGATNAADTGFFAGTLDEVRVWNYARSAAEISVNKNVRVTTASGLIGRWSLTEASGTIVNDTSGSAINGTLLPNANPPTWITDSAFAPSVAITSPANNAAFTTGVNIPLTATASTPNGAVTNVAYYAGVTKLGDATVGPAYSLTWNSVAAGNYVLTAVVSDNLGATNSSAPVNISVTSGAPAGTNLVFNFTNQWRYMQTSNLDGTLWKQPAYSDAAWPAGQGVLGLEDCGCLPQPIVTPLTLFTNRLTHYFRTHFTFSGNPAEVSLQFASLIDNGAVIYLNGVEIQRVRMPAGTITDTTPASEGVGDATAYDTFTISGNLLTNLVVGDNVVAVEIHQADFSSSDVVFGSSLSVVTSGGGSPASGGLSFDGLNDMVTMGVAPGLGVTNFTIECWFKQQSAGKRANTGTSGIFAVPLVTKGMAEGETTVTNANYFFGIGTNNAGQAVLAADFEDFNNGLNHPVRGNGLVTSGAWQHGAVTYNSASSNWVLYLNGVPDATNTVTGPSGITNLLMLIPRADSLEHAALGSSLRTGGSTNADSGFFGGTMDEVRIWNLPRTAQQIADNYNVQLTNGTGLIARWSLDETGGATTAGNSVSGGVNGTLANGPVWAAGYPFPALSNAPPVAPIVVTPANGDPNVSTNATLAVTISDPEASNLTVTYYGRVAGGGPAPGPDFTFLALPDTQHYSAGINGGIPDMFTNQTQWIVNNRASRNIQYLAQLGDCVQNGDNGGNDVQWRVATNSLYRLENPLTTLLPEGLPYGVAVGNHDQGTNGNGDPNGPTKFYNQYFGESHFGGYNYYGDHYGTNNDNHYDLFSASGLDFIVVYFEHDATMTTNSPVIAWANSVLATNQNRRAIVASHWIINAGFNATFSTQGQAIYDGMKGNTNLFLMLCGHVSPEEGQRTNVYQGRTVWTIMTDYQGRAGGGNGWLRLYEFSPSNNVIRATTYSPWLNQTETDSSSQFNIPYTMTTANPFSVIGASTGVPSGANASMIWSNRTPGVEYEWYVTVSDGVNTTTGPVLNFIVTSNAPSGNQPPVANSQTLTNTEDTQLAITLTGSDPEGSNITFAVVGNPLNGNLSGVAPNLIYTPSTNYTGGDSFTFRVNDGVLNSALATVSITVTPVNDAPTIAGLTNQTINMNASTGPLNFTVGDLETAAASLTVSATSSNPALAPTGNIVFGGSGASRTVAVTPVTGQSGSATITVIVSDGSLSASNSFALSVVPLISVTNSFTNTAAITIPTSGSATPYPSVITVSNTVGNISNVTVTLRGMNHTWPADVDVLLVSPAGQKVIIFSDVGASNDLNNVTVTLSDAAATALSATAQIVAGTFKPTNVEPGENGELDAFPTQSGPFASTMSAFNGVSPNGAWSLYVVDDATGDLGNVATGWSLAITTVSSGPVPPAITNQPASQTISCGNNATLTVGASGGAPLNYQWYFSNTLLVGKTNATLTLNGAGGSNDGSYVVTVQNISGSVTSTPAVLTIIDTNAPIILTCATNIALNAGALCQAAIPNLMTQIVASDSCSSVTITQSPAVGTLVGLGSHPVTLIVKDAANNQASCVATVTVNDATAPLISTCASNAIINAGTNCQATIPDLTGQMVASDACSAVTITQSPVAGTVVGLGNHLVTLTVSDAATNLATCSATITVFDVTAPIIATCATNMTLNADTNCQATIPDLTTQVVASDSCGPVTITQSPTAGTIVGLGNTLVTLTVSDAATNLVTCNATMTVVDASTPVITAQPESLTNLFGSTAIFNVTATSCSAISYQWMFGTNTVAGATTTTLTITNIQSSHAGDYSVVLANAAGNSTSIVATLTVMLPLAPTLSAGPVILPNGHFSVGFTGTPNVPYTIECATNVVGPWETLTNLTSATNGLISVEDLTEPVPPMRFYRTVYP